MKEFDFDELDKAVSNLMGDVSSTPDSDTTVTEPTQSTPPADDQTPSDTTATPTAEAEQATPEPSSLPQPSDAPTAPLAAKPPATKRAGRFMDVVHPSSDMKSSASKPSREGVTITPPSAQPSSDETTETPAQPQPEAVEELEASETGDTSNDDTSEPEPLTTPFLPDAKVEKRPLGSAGPSLDEQMANELGDQNDSTSLSDTAQPTPSAPVADKEQSQEPTMPSDDDTSTPSDDDTQRPAEAEAAVLPPELGEELVAIESGEKTKPEPVTTTEEKPEAATAESTAKPTASAQGSITQQYAEQPSSSDASHAAIFDNAADHSPLTHPKKHHSGWLWVLVVVILLALGAAGGSAIYFFELV